jgi:hypothetical protein
LFPYNSSPYVKLSYLWPRVSSPLILFVRINFFSYDRPVVFQMCRNLFYCQITKAYHSFGHYNI